MTARSSRSCRPQIADHHLRKVVHTECFDSERSWSSTTEWFRSRHNRPSPAKMVAVANALSWDVMRIELIRTFSAARDAHDGEQDWSDYLGSGRGKLTWTNLRERPLVVVVGQAGIGKTIEFELEAQRLIDAGRPAFFVALNQLVDSES